MSATKGLGAWVPWPAVERVAMLRLRPASRWQVFFLILSTSCRYGGRPAILTVAQIAERTGLGVRTVKSALKGLIDAGHVRRVGRYRKLVVAASITANLLPVMPPTELPPP